MRSIQGAALLAALHSMGRGVEIVPVDPVVAAGQDAIGQLVRVTTKPGPKVHTHSREIERRLRQEARKTMREALGL